MLMKKYFFLTGLLILFSGCTGALNVTDFQSCADAGNKILESYPRQCVANGVTYTENLTTTCTPNQRNVDACTLEYNPVCASVNVQCIKAPCNPVQEDYGNPCQACSNPNVESYVPGECS